MLLVCLFFIPNPFYVFKPIFRGKIFSVSVKDAPARMASILNRKTRLHRTIDFAPKSDTSVLLHRPEEKDTDEKVKGILSRESRT